MDDLVSAEGTEDNERSPPPYWISEDVKYHAVTKHKAIEYDVPRGELRTLDGSVAHGVSEYRGTVWNGGVSEWDERLSLA